MVVVLPISHVDIQLSHAQADRFLALGGCPTNDAVVVCPIRAHPLVDELVTKLNKVFQSVKVHFLSTECEDGWPRSCNHSFYHACKFMAEQNQPWYLMEPDVVPIKKAWLKDLTGAYQTCGKLFFGVVHPSYAYKNKEKIEFGKHLVGTGIYPPNVFQHSLLINYLLKQNVAWDVFWQWEISPLAAHTDLIQHNWSSQNYRKDEAGQIICDQKGALGVAKPLRDDAVVLHGCKDLSLYQILASNEPATKRRSNSR